jgi:hypothetical protein
MAVGSFLSTFLVRKRGVPEVHRGSSKWLKWCSEMSARATSLEFLQAVYLNEQLPLSVRLRAAVEAAPYEHPKLTAVALGRFTGEDFATRLERAVEASNRAKLIEGRVIERDD